MNMIYDDLYHVEVPNTFTLGGRALFVEDAPEVRNALTRTAERVFAKVHVAVDGLDGFEKVKSLWDRHQESYRIVISDIDMPHMNGVEMIKKMKEWHEENKVIQPKYVHLSSNTEIDRNGTPLLMKPEGFGYLRRAAFGTLNDLL